MELIFTARSRLQKNMEYIGLSGHGLKADVELAGGTGSARDPWQANVKIHNCGGNAWFGVIHVELPFGKQNPRLFLPAFMYGRNRGEAPQNVPNQFPRLREGNPTLPSSPWWMVRSDRLSHPAALVYDEGHVYGLCASPYWISSGGRKQQWLPGDRHYSTFVYEDAESGGYRYNKIISISWTNGMTVAAPMLMAALRLNDEPMRQQALSCITNIIEHSMNPESGLPYDAYQDGIWSIKGWWFDGMRTPGHSAYLVAQAMFYILKGYDYELRIRNCQHNDWLVYVKQVLDRMERTKNTDGEYPIILSERTGAGLEYDGFSGVWCLAALAYYSWLTKDLSSIDGLRRSEAHYYDTYVKHMECYGAPLDADKSIDSEGILAYIKAVRFLHALTGDDLFLDHMRDAIGYEFSFKFCYNSPVKIPPLSTLGWSSSGGSVTSVANPHIHPMSSNLVDELFYYVQQREEAYVLQRMMDTIGWGCQTYNHYDQEYGYGKKGWMSERFCHSEGLVTEKYADGTPASTWFCLMPWAGGSVIEGLAGDYWEYSQTY